MTNLLLGLDISTGGVKGALVDARGKVIAREALQHRSHYPVPGGCEHDMEANWWENPIKIIRNLIKVDKNCADRIAAISISGLYPALGPTDGQGKPLRMAILYSDNRSVEEAEEINRLLDLCLTTEELTPKLIWFLRREPDLAAGMKMVFYPAHYAIYKLSGAYVTDTISAGMYGAIYATSSASWHPDICDKLGVPLDILPEVFPPAEIVGEVHSRAAAETGLKTGTPVLAGIPDTAATLLGAGVTEVDETMIYYGSTGVVPTLKMDMRKAVWEPYPVEDECVFDYPSYSLSVGDAVDWFRDQLLTSGLSALGYQLDPITYSGLDQLAANTPPGCEGLILLPHFMGQRAPSFNPQARGVYFGITEAHTLGHFFRAVLESFGYGVRHGLEASFPDGIPHRRVVAVGGGAKSLIWRQIVSDITGLNQEYIPDVDGTMGNAYLAGLGLGWFEDFGVLKKEWLTAPSIVEPDCDSRKIYDGYYPIYCELHDALAPTFGHHQQILTSFEAEKTT